MERRKRKRRSKKLPHIKREEKMKKILSELKGRQLKAMMEILQKVPTAQLQRAYDANIERILRGK